MAVNIIKMTNILHAHKWGTPWTNHLKVFHMNKEQQNILHDACEKNDIEILKNKKFISLYNEIDEYIRNNGPMFFKLSSISPKDSYYKDPTNAPLLQASNADKLFNVFVTSMRITEELEDNDLFPIILSPWNDKISEDDEYRCFIFYGNCEAIAKRDDESEPTSEINSLITNFIEKHKKEFPDQTVALDVAVEGDNVIFIEFNPVDDELDTYGIVRNRELSTKALMAIAREPVYKNSIF